MQSSFLISEKTGFFRMQTKNVIEQLKQFEEWANFSAVIKIQR